MQVKRSKRVSSSTNAFPLENDRNEDEKADAGTARSRCRRVQEGQCCRQCFRFFDHEVMPSMVMAVLVDGLVPVLSYDDGTERHVGFFLFTMPMSPVQFSPSVRWPKHLDLWARRTCTSDPTSSEIRRGICREIQKLTITLPLFCLFPNNRTEAKWRSSMAGVIGLEDFDNQNNSNLKSSKLF
ncbi:hypothetical protein CEXT_621771 [Caerostris extrusa]|uniref:Uncharacterized protein n=1 Tax=Caerostris extrusa TaxID=172846 RepID=A0AAV4N757_CAEEX|nr:hypothetical protein CEXT_621771 [Caerostris extrusa]